MFKKISTAFKILSFTTTLAFVSASAYALPLPSSARPFAQLPFAFTADHDFEGIVALSNCSGSLVRLERSADTDQALVLTNGHCLENGMPEYGTYVSHEPSRRSFQLMDKSGTTVQQLRAVEIVYSTMTGTDMTLYRVAETYADISARSRVRPFMLAAKRPQNKTAITVVSGYWHRGYTCTIDGFVPQLKEGDWTWSDSIRYSQPGCEVIHGTSGSPIIEKGTRTVIGINNTGNDDGERCTIDNPCEVDESGNVTYRKGLSYGQQTYWVYSCLNQKNEIDLTVAGCQLFHGQ